MDVDLAEDNTLNNQKNPDALCPAADVDPATDDLNDDPTANVNPVRDVVVPNSSPTADVDPTADDLNDHLTADVNPVRDAVEPKSSPTVDVDPTADVPSKADEDVHPSATGISPADVDLAENKLYSNSSEQKLGQVSAQASDVDQSEDKILINQKFPVTDVYPTENDFIDHPTAGYNPVRDAIVPNSGSAADVDPAVDVSSKADEDVRPAAAAITEDVDLAGNKLCSNNAEQKIVDLGIRKVFAILDDPRKDKRGDCTIVFVEKNATLADALKKLNEQQSNAVWGFPVDFLGITTKSDRFIRCGHLQKSDLTLNICDVMLEEDYLVLRPSNLGEDHFYNALPALAPGPSTGEAIDANKIKLEHDYARSAMMLIQSGNLSKSAEEGETEMMLTNGKWGPAEDAKLVAGLLKYGTKWSQIRKEFGLMYRSSFSLSKRSRRKALQFRLQQARNLKYGNIEAPLIKGLEALTASMNPLLNQNPSNADLGNNNSNRNTDEDQLHRKRNWSAEEDEELINGIQKYGPKWSTIYRESVLIKQRPSSALSKRARKKSFVATYKKATENSNALDNLHSSLPAKFTDIITPINNNMELGVELKNNVVESVVSNLQNMPESHFRPTPSVEAMIDAHENNVSKAVDLSKSLSPALRPGETHENVSSNLSDFPKSIEDDECKHLAV